MTSWRALPMLLTSAIAATAAFGAIGFASTPAFAAGVNSASAVRPLSQALAGNGALRHVQGSFSARGYRMVLAPNGAPRFVRSRTATTSAAPIGSTASVASTASLPDANWSDAFGNVGLTYATPNAIAVSGANVYIGGGFSILAYDSHLPVNNVAWWNGRGWHALGAGSNNGVNGIVRAIAVSGSNVYVGGDFTSAGGAAASHIAKWNGSAWSALGSGVTNASGTPSVNALAVSGSTLYAAGSFDDAGGVVAHSVAAWNGTGWSALGGGLLSCTYFDAPGHCFSTPSTGQVNALLVSGSNLYAGGTFNDVAGAQVQSLAVWNGSAWSAVGGASVSGSSHAVYALATSGGVAPTLYVGGKFTTIGTVNANSIASWNGTNWSALGTGADNCSGCGPGAVTALQYWAGKLFMGGDFYGAGGDNTPTMAQWNGTSWTAVGPDGNSSSAVLAFAVAPGGLVAGGQFTSANASTVTLNGIGLWSGVQWTGYGFGVSQGTNAGLLSAAAASNHDLYVGGSFATAGWTRASNLAHFNGTRWDGMGGGVTGGLPFAIAIYGRDVFVGGSFSQAGSVAASNIAMWDGTSWHALGSGVDSGVLALLVYNGKLWAGGSFSHAGGVAANDVATWDLATQTWAAVGGDLHYDGGQVVALAGLSSPYSHYVVIGGDFLQIDAGPGTALTVNGLVMFDTSAAITGPFSGYSYFPGANAAVGVSQSCGAQPCPGGRVNALLADGLKLYIGGNFDDGGDVASRGFALLDLGITSPNGWSSPGVVGGGGKTVNALTQVGSSYYLAGDFGTAGGAASPNVAEYTPATSTWTALGTGLSSGVSSSAPSNALAQSADGLYVGGSFGLAGGMAAENLALWTATAFPMKVAQTASPSSVSTDSPVTFTSKLTNSATTSAAGVTLTVALPSNVAFGTATPSQGTCGAPVGTRLSCALGTLAAGASATVAITVTPIQPGAITNAAWATESGSTNTSSTAVTSVSVTATSNTSYVAVGDTGFSPVVTTALPGRLVQFNLLGPKQHSAKDASPLALFDSGLRSPVTYYQFRYTAAGSYPVADAGSTHTTTVNVNDTLSASSIAHGSPAIITMASATPAAGYVLDIQVLTPGGAWAWLHQGLTTPTTTYTPTAAGTYQFRSRLRNAGSGAATPFSPPVSLSAT